MSVLIAAIDCYAVSYNWQRGTLSLHSEVQGGSVGAVDSTANAVHIYNIIYKQKDSGGCRYLDCLPYRIYSVNSIIVPVAV